MGAENSILDNFNWEDSHTVATDDWVVKSGRLVDGDARGSHISLFTPKNDTKGDFDRLRKLTKKAMSLRHPAILHYIASGENSEGPYLVTEQVVPLQSVLDQLSSIEICAGLYSILDGLAFLHEKAGLCHNNICQKSVYVCKDGSWQLGGLEHACCFTDATDDYLKQCVTFRSEAAISPEEKKNKIDATREGGQARDMFAFAVLSEELLEKLEDFGDMTKTFELRIQDECLCVDARKRPSARSLLTDRLFTNDFLEVAVFLKQVTMKTEDEKKQFFRGLLPKLLELPEDLVGRRLITDLLCRFVLLDQSADEFVVPHILTPCTDLERPSTVSTEGITPVFTAEAYKQFVIPELMKIFSVHDLHIRLLLLQYFSSYVSLFDREDLEVIVFPQILLGLRDTSDILAASSLRALADVVPILGRDTVIGGNAKKYFKEGKPKLLTEHPSVNNKLSNVSGMMGKVLLKDLAGFSSLKEKKMKERERRREEARKKREQKKELMKGKAAKLTSVHEEEVEGQDQSSESHKESDSIGAKISEEHSETKPSDWSDEDINSAENDILSPDRINSSADSADDKMGPADWPDWQAEEEEESWASDISDEIEEEIQKMETAVKITEDNSHQHQGTRTSGPVSEKNKANINDSLSQSNHGALKLKSQTKTKPASQSDITVNDLLPSIEKTISYSDNTSSTRGDMTHAKIVSPSSKHSGNVLKMTSSIKSQSLGAEFDIKNVEIKPIKSKDSGHFDFFADMEPSVQSTKSSVFEEMLSAGNVELNVDKSVTSSLAKPSVSFDMVVQEENIEETAGDGWGDGDWGEDF